MSEDPPNVVLITSHDLGQHIGCYGIDTVETPNLDGIAASGLQFENAVSTTPVCSPARGSLLTGRYPQSNGLMGLTHSPWWWRIDGGESTLPELLGAAGYETHLSGFQHVGDSDSRLGFDHYYGGDAKDRAAAVGDIFERENDGPIYAQVGFFETHRPFERDPYDKNGIFVPDYLEPTETIREDLARFQADINHLDEQVGRILSELEDAGVRENTILIFAVDHGIPYPGAKWWCREPGVEISLLMDGPGKAFESSGAIDPMISNVDVLPTLLDLLERPIPDRVEGVSFRPYLEGEVETPPREMAFTQYTSAGDEARGVVTQDYTLIRNFGAGRTIEYPVDTDPSTREGPTTDEPRPFAQLYRRPEDAANINDVSNEESDAVTHLSGHVRSWMARVEDPLLTGGIQYPYNKRATRDLLSLDT